MYAYLVAAIVGLVALGAAGYKGYGLGADHVRAEYADRYLAAVTEAAALTQATQEKYRAQEQAHSQAVAQIATDYQGRLTDAQAKTALALNSIRSGSVRLRDPGAKACSDPAPGTAATASRSDGDSASGLSDQLATFLVSEAARADQVVLQLSACQQVVISDRK
jgi:prophage endopeptidase